MLSPLSRQLDGLRVLGLPARLGLAAVWWVSGALKVIDPARTRTALRAYEILPHGLTGLVATALPLVEPALGTLLVGALGLDEWLRGRTATGDRAGGLRPGRRAVAGREVRG